MDCNPIELTDVLGLQGGDYTYSNPSIDGVSTGSEAGGSSAMLVVALVIKAATPVTGSFDYSTAFSGRGAAGFGNVVNAVVQQYGSRANINATFVNSGGSSMGIISINSTVDGEYSMDLKYNKNGDWEYVIRSGGSVIDGMSVNLEGSGLPDFIVLEADDVEPDKEQGLNLGSENSEIDYATGKPTGINAGLGTPVIDPIDFAPGLLAAGFKAIIVGGIKAVEKAAVEGTITNFTKSSFRKNLIKATGLNPGKVSQAHHVFPQKFESIFLKEGINIHDPKFGVWWKTSSHLKNAADYNNFWKQFLKTNPDAAQILDEGRKLMQQYGIPVKF